MNAVSKNTTLIEFVKNLNLMGIPEKDYKKYVGRYLEFKARERAIPLTGSFELTPLCNLDCKMCYVHLNNNQFDVSSLLPIEKWKSIIIQAYNLGMRRASITGGECLTYPGFDDVYLCLYDLGIAPGILTNGILVDNNRLSFFEKHPPKQIQVSLYGSSNDAYEIVTGHRVFETVYNNLCSLREHNIPVKIAITPNKFMKNDIESLLEKVEKLKIPYYINYSLFAPRENTGRNKEDLALDDYVYLLKKKYNTNNEEQIELPDESKTYSKKYGLVCGGGRSSFAIKYDGLMCPCTSLDSITTDPFELGFKRAWEELNNKVNNYLLPVECGECVYKTVCPECVALHKDALKEGHCNHDVCERTKRLVKEGFISIPVN